ncbi:MAG: NAD-binding protein [Cyclobacteriaceae bacterium]|nr:NAD-binding protein [Cyclobacteriaceae bacterium]
MKGPDIRRAIATILIVLTVYGILITLLLQLESGIPGSKINTLQDAMWYLMETLTTVGYGDALPVTYWGRMIGFVFLFSSFGVYGFIIGNIANFMTTLKEQKELGFGGTKFSNHAVIIGWNEFGQSVVSTLIAAGRQVAVVTKDRSSIAIIHEFYPDNQVFTLFSDYNNFELLEKVNVKEAAIVFINLNDDTEKLVYIINIRKHYQNLNYVVTLDNGNLKSTFTNAGCTYAISKNEISSKLLASYIFEPDVAILSEELIAYAHEDHEYDMKEFQIRGTNPLIGIPYEKAFFDLKKQSNVILFGLVRVENGQRKLYKNPESSLVIQNGDYLIMLMDGKGTERLKRIFQIDEGV